MSLPVVAIVGRPNVGKSSLMNALVNRRISIVDPTPGVTRDRISAVMPLGEGYIELMDTGGYGIEDRDNLTGQITGQIGAAIDLADMILFVVDAREGITPLDRTVAEKLRRQDKPVLLVANKVDDVHAILEVGQLGALGFGEAISLSASHRLNLDTLQDAILERLGEVNAPAPAEPVMKLAIVGKRNAGKSTFINALAGQERVIVSEVPGTTRDSVDVNIELDGRKFLVIDTAGVKKKSKQDNIEFYSQHRTLRSIRRADVVMALIDATEPIGMVEKQLAGYVEDLFKPTVLVVNKWDLAKAKLGDPDKYGPYLAKSIPELAYAPLAFVSAKEGVGVRLAVDLAEQLFVQAGTRVSTSQLNATLEEIISTTSPKPGKLGPTKILYATQIDVSPPTIVMFVNNLESFDPSYQRFIIHQFRERLPWSEVPVRLIVRQRRRELPEYMKREPKMGH